MCHQGVSLLKLILGFQKRRAREGVWAEGKALLGTPVMHVAGPGREQSRGAQTRWGRGLTQGGCCEVSWAEAHRLVKTELPCKDGGECAEPYLGNRAGLGGLGRILWEPGSSHREVFGGRSPHLSAQLGRVLWPCWAGSKAVVTPRGQASRRSWECD